MHDMMDKIIHTIIYLNDNLKITIKDGHKIYLPKISFYI